MSKARKTYSNDHPRLREAGFQPPGRRLPLSAPHPELGLLRAARDRLPRWG
ncbi:MULTISPECIES: hypothetical protein [unclassified Aureimonas]|uniref:hypothetical protein n=1 Tax=unclassified Aureimonas TaxID=2615206 RepID=UPI0012E39534|nr:MULTISPECIES: hypothetical protein [unclassified Aureimonas]